MNHKILPLMAAGCLLAACTDKAPQLSEEQLQELVASIPDHQFDPENAPAFTDEYFAALCTAWELPDGGLGEIGNDEFLYYFVCGNDPCESHQSKLHQMTTVGDTLLVSFDILHQYEHEPDSHTLKLVTAQGQWQIADYDNTLAEMKAYIAEQRTYLRSDEYRAAAQAILDDPEADEDWKQAVIDELEEVKTYLETHP